MVQAQVKLSMSPKGLRIIVAALKLYMNTAKHVHKNSKVDGFVMPPNFDMSMCDDDPRMAAVVSSTLIDKLE